MTDKEKRPAEESVNAEEGNLTNAETEAAAEAEAQDNKGISGEEIIAKAVAEAEEFKSLAQRIQADFDNYRKRNNESVKQARAEGNNEVILNLLPVVDAVDIALKVIPDEKSREGVGLILRQIQALFGRYGVKEIEAEGQMFDPELHNAVMQEEDPENSGKIIEVLQKGYTREGKVLRHAMVKVAK